jgi:uncharacterized protein (TIGR02118 family)
MAQLIVLYKTPKDAAAFDKHYSETHIPLAKKIPGLMKFTISQGPVVTPSGPSGVHMVAVLQFDNMAAIQTGFATAEGRAAAADAQTLGPLEMLLFETREA